MSSLVEMQYQQHFPQQQTQPLSLAVVQKYPQPDQQQPEKQEQQTSYLAAVSGNNYAHLRRAARRQRQQQNRRHMQPFRPLVGAATNNHGGYASGQSSAHAGPYVGYGSGPATGGDYNNYHSNSQHGSSGGGGYIYNHPNSASGYGDPHQTYHAQSHPAHPPANQAPIYHAPVHNAPKPAKSKGKNKKGDTTLSALTLLSFFFFVNLLQNCLKDHMNDINPTVMVMTTNGVRNRFNKLAEMNSREQNAAAVASVSPAAAQSLQNAIVLEPGDLIAVASSHSEPSMAIVQSPYSSNIMDTNKAITIETMQHYNYNNNNNHNNNKQHGNKNNANSNNNKQHNNKYNAENEQHQYANLLSNQSVRPEFYDSVHSYSNRNKSYSYPRTAATATATAASNNVFSTYIRSSGSSLADKSHNYSFHSRRDKPTFQTQKDLDRYDDAYTNIESSYFSALGSTPAPKTYWSLAAKSSSTSDLYEHHTDADFAGDDNNDFNIDRRYSADSAYAHYTQRN